VAIELCCVLEMKSLAGKMRDSSRCAKKYYLECLVGPQMCWRHHTIHSVIELKKQKE
jgi:hypothetical protein